MGCFRLPPSPGGGMVSAEFDPGFYRYTGTALEPKPHGPEAVKFLDGEIFRESVLGRVSAVLLRNDDRSVFLRTDVKNGDQESCGVEILSFDILYPLNTG